jgi:hypothetical protein
METDMTAMPLAMNQEVRELTPHELEAIGGGLDIGPLHIESGKGLFTIGIGGYGIWVGEGCVGAYTPDRVLGACLR